MSLSKLLSWLRPAAPVTAPPEPPPVPEPDLLTPRDRERLKGVHPDLVRVVERARKYETFIVSEGVRTMERQREMVAKGLSKTMASRHLTGHAVDLYPVNGKQVADMPRADYVGVVAAMKRAATELGVKMEHGHDWGWDSPHHELTRAAYP
jgi:peptidoglycan L-alanyl-D-glutamate endopeptidase CwlK